MDGTWLAMHPKPLSLSLSLTLTLSDAPSHESREKGTSRWERQEARAPHFPRQESRRHGSLTSVLSSNSGPERNRSRPISHTSQRPAIARPHRIASFSPSLPQLQQPLVSTRFRCDVLHASIAHRVYFELLQAGSRDNIQYGTPGDRFVVRHVFPCLRVLQPGRSVCSVCHRTARCVPAWHHRVRHRKGASPVGDRTFRPRCSCGRAGARPSIGWRAQSQSSGRTSVGDLCMAIQIVPDPCPPALSMVAGHDAGCTTWWDVVTRLNWR